MGNEKLVEDVSDRIDGDTVQVHLIVEVRTRGSARVPHLGDFLMSPHDLAFLDKNLLQVGIHGVQTITVVDGHRFSITRVPFDGRHYPIGRSNDRGPFPAANVKTAV